MESKEWHTKRKTEENRKFVRVCSLNAHVWHVSCTISNCWFAFVEECYNRINWAQGLYTFVTPNTHTLPTCSIFEEETVCVCVDPCYTSIYHPYLFFQFRRIQFCWLNFWHCFRSIYSLITVSSFKTLPNVYIPISWTQFENEPTHTLVEIDSSRSESGHSSPNSTLQHRKPAQKFHL